MTFLLQIKAIPHIDYVIHNIFLQQNNLFSITYIFKDRFFFDIWTTSQFSSYLPFQDERKMLRVCRLKR